MAYTPFTWVDDDGSGTVGTIFSATRMNQIEQGIATAARNPLRTDSVASSAAGTGTLEWTHEFLEMERVRGLLVLIVANDTTPSDEVTAVTASGVAMKEVPLSPFLHTLGTEDGVIYAYFMSSIELAERGGGFMKVTVSGATSKKAVSIAIQADDYLRVEDTTTLDSAASTEPSVAMTIDRNECIFYAAIHSGVEAPTSITASSTGAEKIAEVDFGTTSAAWLAQTPEIGATSATVAAKQTEDEAGMFGIAIGRVSDSKLFVERKASTAELLVEAAHKDVPNCTVTLPDAGRYIITGVFDIEIATGPSVGIGALKVDGVEALGAALFGGAAGSRGSVMQQWVVEGNAGTVVKLTAARTAATTVRVNPTHTTILVEQVVPA